MNVKNVLKLADRIECLENTTKFAKHGRPAQAGTFSMRNISHTCGLPACISGWAFHLAVEEFHATPPKDQHKCNLNGSGWLGFDEYKDREILKNLFVPRYHEAHTWDKPGETGYISSKRAAAVLRHLAETGEVDWSIQP